ncbi:MAG: ATP synthase F1 subunit delta [Clostridia bacterium]|nr:ATP synthase F1 subunit delta [Clostridia bacterium]
MNDLPLNYAKVLFDMDINADEIKEMRELLESGELSTALDSPLVSKVEKRKVIDKLFPQSTRNFVKVMSDNGDIGISADMFEEFDAMKRAKEGTIVATLTYVTKPDDAQIEQLKKKIAKDYNKNNVVLQLVEDPSLIGGFVLRVGESVLDQSVKTSMAKLKRHFAVR